MAVPYTHEAPNGTVRTIWVTRRQRRQLESGALTLRALARQERVQRHDALVDACLHVLGALFIVAALAYVVYTVVSF